VASGMKNGLMLEMLKNGRNVMSAGKIGDIA
jgi:hypothetical protein